MDDDLSDRSDLYVLREMELASLRGECITRFVVELRRRLYSLRTQEMLYHVDAYRETIPSSPSRRK